MGNRANIVLPEHKLSIYLHWNGGPESVAAFLKYAEDVGIRHDDYYPARLMQIIGNFFGGTSSLGISSWDGSYTDHGDNGTYVIRTENSKEPDIKHRGVTRSLSELISTVRHHGYWSSEGDSIMDALAKANDPFFRKS